MSNEPEIFKTMFSYKAWADAEMFDRLKEGSRGDPAYTQTLHVALRILNHVYVVDTIFQANLQGIPHGCTALNTVDIPSLDDLHVAVCDADRWFLDYLPGLTADQIHQDVAFAFVDGSPGLMTRGAMLMHVLTHGVYHRGAVGQILSSHGLEPPKDGLTAFLTHNKSETRPIFAAPSHPREQLIVP